MHYVLPKLDCVLGRIPDYVPGGPRRRIQLDICIARAVWMPRSPCCHAAFDAKFAEPHKMLALG